MYVHEAKAPIVTAHDLGIDIGWMLHRASSIYFGNSLVRGKEDRDTLKI